MDIFTSVKFQRLDQGEPETIIPDIEESVFDNRNDHRLWCSKTAVTEKEECILPHSPAETSKYQDGYDIYYNRFGTAPEEILPDRMGQFAGEVHLIKEEDDDSLVEIKAGEDYEIVTDDDEADKEFGIPNEFVFKADCTERAEVNSNFTSSFIVQPELSTFKERNSEYVFPINISEQCRMITDIISMNSHAKETLKEGAADMRKEEDDDLLVEIKSEEDYVIIPDNDGTDMEVDKEHNSEHDINDKDLKEKQNFQGAIYFNKQHSSPHSTKLLGDGYVTLVDFQPNPIAGDGADQHPQCSVRYNERLSGCPTPESRDNAHLVSERPDLQSVSVDSNYTSSPPDQSDILHSLLSNPQYKRKRISNILKKQSDTEEIDKSGNNRLPKLEEDLNKKQDATLTRMSSYVTLEKLRKVTVLVNGKLEERTVVLQCSSSQESSEEGEDEDEANSKVPQIENVFTLKEKPKTIPKRRSGMKRDVTQPMLYCSVSANSSVMNCPEHSCNSTAFKSMLYLRKHIEETHLKLRCKICGLLFTFRNHSFVNHMEMKHGSESEKDLPASCYLCNMEFSSSYFLQKHQYETHEDYEYKCRLCGMSFSLEASLAQHRREEHISNDATYKCDFCPSYYLTMSSCLEHIMMIHTHKYFSIVCCDCRILFPNRDTYIRHCTLFHNLPSKRMTLRKPKSITPFKRKVRGARIASNVFTSYIPKRTEGESEMQIPPFSLFGSSEMSTQTYEIPDGPEGDLCRLTQTLEMEMTPNLSTISPSESPRELKILPENDKKIKNASLEMLEAELCRQAQELERQKIEKKQNNSCNRTFNFDVNTCTESTVKSVETEFNKEVGRSAVSFLVCEDEDLKSQINRGTSLCHRIQPNIYVIEDSDDNDDQL